MGVYIEQGEGNLVAGCTLRNLGLLGVCIGQGARPDPRPCGEWARMLAAENGQFVPIEPLSRQLGDYLGAIYANTIWNRNAGSNHGVVGCDIYNTGCGGVSLGGGDRKTLAPAGNYVLNCCIHHFNRLDHSYRGGVNIDGVGNRVAHCLIHDAAGCAILLWGNDHVIEYNEIDHACLCAGDMGAFYTGRDPSQRGSVLRYNFFHHTGDAGADAPGFGEVCDIYWDDGACGLMAWGNVFYKTAKAFLINAGHDHVVRNNTFIEAGFGRVTVKNNTDWSGYMHFPIQVLRLRKAVNATAPPYVARYPKLAHEFDGSPSLHRGNEVRDNVSIRSGDFREDGKELKDNLVMQEDPGFVDAVAMNFQLKPDSIVFKKLPGFQKIPFEKIGLYKDECRQTIPQRVANERRTSAKLSP